MSSLRGYFYDLGDYTKTLLKGKEEYTANLSGEVSDFCRLNGAKVRQAGSVEQTSLTLQLIDGGRHAKGDIALSKVKDEDRRRLASLVQTLRDQVRELPEDPYLLFATDVRSSDTVQQSKLTDSHDVVSRVAQAAKGLDMVGIYAAGGVYRGFANSFGQRNWYETHSFNLDWSFYLRADKAVKTGYAGFEWQDDAFAAKIEGAREQLAVLKKDPRTISPGKYRVYLAPQALTEVTDLLSWGGFGLKAHKTKQTPLLKMVEADHRMHDSVTIREHTAGGVSPNFSESGFVKPAAVTMVQGGRFQDCLISPRSAKEYGASTNGATDSESPLSLEIGAGKLKAARAAAELGEGIYINNLWYLNFSDRPACRVTGMTRFASFWVEKGKITQPLNVMRFDESVLKMLGDKLVSLTEERELILSASTYGQRSTGSAHLPGALVSDFSFTL